MINFEAFRFSDYAKEKINLSVQNYWRHARIQVTGERGYNKDGELILAVNLAQKELVNDRILTVDELVLRGTEIFNQEKGLVPDGQKIEISATPYMP